MPRDATCTTSECSAGEPQLCVDADAKFDAIELVVWTSLSGNKQSDESDDIKVYF